MPRYYWQNSSISEADLMQNLQYRHAVLRLNQEMSADAIAALPAKLQRHGLIAIPTAREGKITLRLRGFQDEAALFDILAKEGLTQGSFTRKEPLEEELHPEIKTLRTYLKEHSIQLAGAVYLIADAMPILSGLVRKTPDEITQGGLWATTSAALLFFGRKNPEIQLGNIYTRMKQFLAEEGVNTDGDCALSLEQLQRDSSYWNMLVNFLYDHPVLFNNSIQGLGGLKQIQAGRAQQNSFKTAAGFGPMLGMWSGLLIPEDKYAGLSPEEKAEKLRLRARGEEPDNGFNTRFVDNPITWVQEKPLRLSGIGPIIGNFLTACSALFHDRHAVNSFFGIDSQKYELNPMRLWQDGMRSTDDLLRRSGLTREALKADALLKPHLRQHEDVQRMLSTQLGWKFTMGTPIFNIIANTLYGMSSKEERSVNLDKAGYLDEVLDMAAAIYAAVPEAARGEKLVRFAGFLKSQPDVNISEQVIRTRLEQKIDALEKAGWRQKLAAQSAAQNAAPQTGMHL